MSDGNLNNPFNIWGSGVDPTQSSAPPYTPLEWGNMFPDPYTGQQNSLYNMQPEIQYNQMLNPQYWSPNQKQTYTGIGNDPTQELQNTNLLSEWNMSPYQAAAPNFAGPSSYDASLIANPANVQDEMSTLLHSETNANGIPSWAQPAATAAQERMNSLGLGASTMAGNAQTSAILNTAMPMAVQNAQMRQGMLLSNQAAQNAAKQFNAQNEQQNNQFRESLITNLNQFNAQQGNDLQKFVANLNNMREQFNVSNQLLVNQSNINWRRAINVANTAGINAVNQANAQNMFNMSMSDQNNLWQQARDEASWSLTSAENARNRMMSLVNSSLNRATSLQMLSSQMNAQMFGQLGSFATNLLGGSFGSNLFGSIFGSGSSGSGSDWSQGFGGGGDFTTQ